MTKFIATGELGRLAKWLRILGFDTALVAPRQDGSERREIVLRSLREERVILTRSSRMSLYAGTRLVQVKSDFVEDQVAQVLKELGLGVDTALLFSRCVVCNEPLAEVPKDSVRGDVTPYIFETQERFKRCGACGRIFWQGTHWALVQKFLQKIR